jgi:c-di-GMP-binding flagellar brake protein YcgR
MSGHEYNLRNAVRFPLHLQVTLKTPGGEYHATTTDISAGGVCFHLDAAIEVGSAVEFAIEMPNELPGANQTVTVMCAGRVVRCDEEAAGRTIAVVIDEYHFQRL